MASPFPRASTDVHGLAPDLLSHMSCIVGDFVRFEDEAMREMAPDELLLEAYSSMEGAGVKRAADIRRTPPKPKSPKAKAKAKAKAKKAAARRVDKPEVPMKPAKGQQKAANTSKVVGKHRTSMTPASNEKPASFMTDVGRLSIISRASGIAYVSCANGSQCECCCCGVALARPPAMIEDESRQKPSV
jgi:hypothetical protein